MVMEKPAWMAPAPGDSAIQYTAQQDRANVLSTLISREGVLYPAEGELRLDQRTAGANMSIDVFAGRCAIRGDDLSDQGTYICNSTTTVNVSTFSTGAALTAPASGTRTHRVVAQLRDKSAKGSWPNGTYDWVFQILQDSGSGTPDVPDSAITLGFVRISAGQGSIQTQHIDTVPTRASVGTRWPTGNILETGINSAYGGRDATRPLRWTKNPDGWVFLAGFIRRTGVNANLGAGQIYYFDGVSGAQSMLPAEARPTGIRDVTMMTDNGPCNLAIYANGAMSFRFRYAETLIANQTWFSFDGIVFRANPFS